jgi:hypothetical protein
MGRSVKVWAGLFLAVAVFWAGAWAAAEETKAVTLTGKVQCAMCILKKADAKTCQDVLVVTGKDAGEYYIVKNDATAQFPHSGCKGDKTATITGTVSEKDGRKWIAATKMEAAKS